MERTLQKFWLVMSKYLTQVSLVSMFLDTMSAAIFGSIVVMWTLDEGGVVRKSLCRTTNPLRSMAKQLNSSHKYKC